MRRTLNQLAIAAAILMASANGAFELTTAGHLTTPDFKTLTATVSVATDGRQLDDKTRTFDKFDVPSRKPSDAPVLVAPSCSEGCGFHPSTWELIQLYISLFA